MAARSSSYSAGVLVGGGRACRCRRRPALRSCRLERRAGRVGGDAERGGGRPPDACAGCSCARRPLTTTLVSSGPERAQLNRTGVTVEQRFDHRVKASEMVRGYRGVGPMAIGAPCQWGQTVAAGLRRHRASVCVQPFRSAHCAAPRGVSRGGESAPRDACGVPACASYVLPRAGTHPPRATASAWVQGAARRGAERSARSPRLTSSALFTQAPRTTR